MTPESITIRIHGQSPFQLFFISYHTYQAKILIPDSRGQNNE